MFVILILVAKKYGKKSINCKCSVQKTLEKPESFLIFALSFQINKTMATSTASSDAAIPTKSVAFSFAGFEAKL